MGNDPGSVFLRAAVPGPKLPPAKLGARILKVICSVARVDAESVKDCLDYNVPEAHGHPLAGEQERSTPRTIRNPLANISSMRLLPASLKSPAMLSPLAHYLGEYPPSPRET